MRGSRGFLIVSISTILLVGVLGFLVDADYNNKYVLGQDTFYFIQITDTHINSFGYPINAEKQFSNFIKRMEKLPNKPIFIIVTGDIVEFGGSGYFGAKNYKKFLDLIKGRKDNLYIDSNIRVYTIPGNHDYRPQFSLSNYHKYVSSFERYVIVYRNLVVICLDSGRDIIEEGKLKASGLSNKDIQWLEKNLEYFRDKIKIIAIHHPIDFLAMNKNKLIDICKKYDVEAIICGHTHRSKIMDIYGKIYSAPIDCYNVPTLIVETDACFHYGAYRPIEVKHNHLVVDNCRYVSPLSRYIFILNKSISFGFLFRMITTYLS